MTRQRTLPIVWSLLLIVCAVVVSSCGGQSPTSPSNSGNPSNPSNPGSATGQVVIFTKANQGWNSIAVSVDGTAVGTLTSSTTATPSCTGGSTGSALVLTKPAGSYTVAASSNGGYQWSGPATVAAGSCNPVELTCPSGDCALTCLFSVGPSTLDVTGVAGTRV